jgi:hypothetical protein
MTMRKLIGIVLALAVMGSASSAFAVAENINLYLNYNVKTGDWGTSNCDTVAGYTVAAQAGLYRDSANNAGAGTPCAATPVYHCVRNVVVNGYTKKDVYLDKNCATRGGTSLGAAGYVLNSACESGATALYLCGYYVYATGTGAAGAPIWFEYRASTSCSGGTSYGLLGYVQGDLYAPTEFGDGCDLSCMGQCGKNCADPLGGGSVYTSQCMAHDQCVVDHGCQPFAIACLAKFVAAAVSYVVAKVKSLVKSIIKGIKKLFSKIF